MHSCIDDVICTCLSRVYSVHMVKTDRLTCTLEHHALPIRHTFFRLKRVPHFQTRDDLHDDHNPAYNPIYRLENASLESLSQKSRAGCRRVLLEGDLGTGKTLVCHRLLHEWAKAMQFFRNVKVEPPYITVDSNDEDTTTCKPCANATKTAFNLDVAAQSSKPAGNQNKNKYDNLSTTSNAVANENSGLSGNSESNKLLCSNDVERSKYCERNNAKEGAMEDKTKENSKDLQDSSSQLHQSRRTLFDNKTEKAENRERSRSNKTNRKSSRSRSASETDTERSRRRSKEKLICDGIPQKYLSLLNISSPGEGSFESPSVSRSRTLREPRRQRPSRLTSNLKDYKAMIYLPCVRLALSELLAKCNNPRVRHYYLAASVLLDLLSFSDVVHRPLPFDAVYHWVLANREDICIIFDNVDASSAWEKLISDAFHDNDGFGKIIVAATPGRIPKRDVDSLFYCYGLSSDYSNKIIKNRLKSEAPEVNDKIQFLLSSSHTQELLCNPLSLSLLSAYFRSVKETEEIPDHLSELLEHLIQQAMAHEVSLKSKINGKRRTFSLQNVCETLAFECLENGTNYFSKQKFPLQFWTRHLCDCRVLHEVHEIANFGPIHERAVSPVTNYSLTPDSDSVHSSNSSILDLHHYSDISSSTQSLASTDADRDAPKRENESPDPYYYGSSRINDSTIPSGPLLQVPIIHAPSDQVRKNAERPKTLHLDTRKAQAKSAPNPNQTNVDIISFTSRCIRDFLASKRVCRYLQSDRDCEAFIQRLISKPQFYPVLRLTVRSLYISERFDLVLDLMDMLMTTQELNLGVSNQPSPPSRGSSPINTTESPMKGRLRHKYRISSSDCSFRAKREDQKQRRSSTSVLGTCYEGDQELTTSSSFNKLLLSSSTLSPYSITPPPQEPTRGYLDDFKEVLIWLAETDNSEPYITAVANRFPNILVISYQECPSETIEHFVCLVKRSSPAIREVVLYMSGFYTQWDLGLKLAESVQELQSITMVTVSMKCVIETSFLVDFICDFLDNNKHIETVKLEGPMNVAENLTQGDHKRIDKLFSQHNGPLKTLILDHFSYHHRVGYILNCWPGVLKNLHLRKCNLDNIAGKITQKISKTSSLEQLSFENCYIPSSTLVSVLKHIRDNSQLIRLVKLDLSLLSSCRRFSKTDVKKPSFKSSITHDVCRVLSEMLKSLSSLKDLVLTNNGITSDKAQIILNAIVHSPHLTSLDMTGNLIGDEVENDVIYLMEETKHLSTLLMSDNYISKEARSAIIKSSLRRHDLRLSL